MAIVLFVLAFWVAQNLAVAQSSLQKTQAHQSESALPNELSIAGAPFMGEEKAPITLIEFTDYQCPYCRRHYRKTMPQLVHYFIKSGKVKYVIRDFPVTRIHPFAAKAAEATHCAGDEGKYWEMRALLFQNQRNLHLPDLIARAEKLGLDRAAFEHCLEGGSYAEQVRRDFRSGLEIGVPGTPSFVLGLTDPEDPENVEVKKMLRGAKPFSAFRDAIEDLAAESLGEN
ncbi:MAG: thioredoxin domain-containing protein [Kiloniellales bacterium]|nr:thioredoxin domain-containing protein [Kiloniellales bacterium]